MGSNHSCPFVDACHPDETVAEGEGAGSELGKGIGRHEGFGQVKPCLRCIGEGLRDGRQGGSDGLDWEVLTNDTGRHD